VFEVQGSVDLADWKPLCLTTNETGTLVCTDADRATLPWRFYRVVAK
jgi:hypothetical protein